MNICTKNQEKVRRPRHYLITIRAEKKISQNVVCLRAGIIQSLYSRIENGYRGSLMNARQLISLADALEVPVEELVRLEARYLEDIDRRNGVIRRVW